MYKIYYNNRWYTLKEYCSIKGISYNYIRKLKNKLKKEYYEILELKIENSKYYMYSK